jgi:HSP20 family protein
MSTLIEPFPAWLRELNRFASREGTISQFVPPADVIVDDDGVTVYMDVPGVNGEQIDIELENDVLTVRGDRPYPYGSDGERITRHVERGFGRFERSMRVPRGMDPDAIEASLSDGVLVLSIPKPPSLKPRRIEVMGGDEARQPDGAPS